jgi:hypothetical protein
MIGRPKSAKNEREVMDSNAQPSTVQIKAPIPIVHDHEPAAGDIKMEYCLINCEFPTIGAIIKISLETFWSIQVPSGNYPITQYLFGPVHNVVTHC